MSARRLWCVQKTECEVYVSLSDPPEVGRHAFSLGRVPRLRHISEPMRRCFHSWLLIAALNIATVALLCAGPATLRVEVDKPGHAISPVLYGIFFEDINCSADGGIYAEMVRNRNFEDSDKPDWWEAVGNGPVNCELALDSTQPVSPKNPHSLRVAISNVGSGRAGVANNGYWGMAVTKGQTYELSLFARGGEGFTGPLAVSLESSAGTAYAESAIRSLTPEWRRYQLALKANATDPKARLAITVSGPGTFWLDMVSLFPKRNWKNRPNGLRPDLAEMLAGLKPGFVRFPGGCWVEGDTMALAYRWKQTIGNLSDAAPNITSGNTTPRTGSGSMSISKCARTWARSRSLSLTAACRTGKWCRSIRWGSLCKTRWMPSSMPTAPSPPLGVRSALGTATQHRLI